jgi:hypothetical protein
VLLMCPVFDQDCRSRIRFFYYSVNPIGNGGIVRVLERDGEGEGPRRVRPWSGRPKRCLLFCEPYTACHAMRRSVSRDEVSETYELRTHAARFEVIGVTFGSVAFRTAQNEDQSAINDRRRSNRSPRRYAASALFSMTCASAISESSFG